MLQHPSVVQRTGEVSERSSGGVTAVDAIHLDCVINLTAVQVENRNKNLRIGGCGMCSVFLL